MYMFGVAGGTHAHDYFEVDIYYVHMYNFHIKEIEISQKRSKGIKN